MLMGKCHFHVYWKENNYRINQPKCISQTFGHISVISEKKQRFASLSKLVGQISE